MSQDSNGYIQLSVPKEVVEEPRTNIDAGQKVTIKGVFEKGEFHIEIEAVE